ASCARGSNRPGRPSGHHGHILRQLQGFEVPCRPAAETDGECRAPRSQEWTRLLQLRTVGDDLTVCVSTKRSPQRASHPIQLNETTPPKVVKQVLPAATRVHRTLEEPSIATILCSSV